MVAYFSEPCHEFGHCYRRPQDHQERGYEHGKDGAVPRICRVLVGVLLHWPGNVYRYAGFHDPHKNNGDYGRGRRETLARREVELGGLDGAHLGIDFSWLRPSGLGVYAFVPAYFVGQYFDLSSGLFSLWQSLVFVGV